MNKLLHRYYNNLNIYINKNDIIKNTFKEIYGNKQPNFYFSIILISIYNINKGHIIISSDIYYFGLCIDIILYSIINNTLHKYEQIINLLLILFMKNIKNDNYFLSYYMFLINYVNLAISIEKNNIINTNKEKQKTLFCIFCYISFNIICKLTLKKSIYSEHKDKIKICGESIGKLLLYYHGIINDYTEILSNKIICYNILYNLKLMTPTILNILLKLENHV